MKAGVIIMMTSESREIHIPKYAWEKSDLEAVLACTDMERPQAQS